MTKFKIKFKKITIYLLTFSFPGLLLIACGMSAKSVDSQQEKQADLVANQQSVTSPPEKYIKMGAGGFVTGIVIHPQAPHTVYARTDNGGLFRLDTNNSNNQKWQQLIVYDRIGVETSRSVESIAIAPNDPDLLYATVGYFTHEKEEKIYGYLLKSEDKGATWSVLDLSLPMSGNGEWRWVGERLAVDPHNSDIVYYGSSLDGLWRSVDGGKSWSQVSTDLVPLGESFGKTVNLPGVTFVEFDAATVANGKTQTIYVGVSGQGVYRTTDGGNTWQALSNNNFSQLVPQQGEVINNGELVVTFYDSQRQRKNGSVWKFAGNNWQDITPKKQENYSALAVDPNNPNHLLVAINRLTPHGVFRSTDGGKSWQNFKNMQEQLPWWPDWTFWGLTGDLAISPQNSSQVWLTTGIGVWQTQQIEQKPVVWSANIDGIEQTVAFDGISTPGGATLITAIADWDGFRYTDITQTPQTNHNGGEFSTSTSIAYSYNNPDFIVRVGGNPSKPEQKVAGFSADNGVTWQNFPSIVNGNHPQDLGFGNIAVSATNTQNIVWQPTKSVAPYYTKDGGNTWTKIPYFQQRFKGGVHTHLWNRQQALAADSVEGSTFYLFHYANGELLRTDDGGENWVVANQNSILPLEVKKDATVRAMPGVAGEVWISLNDKGLYKSSDRGTTFTEIPGVEQAKVFDFGKAADGQTNPTILIQGKVNGQLGVFASTDLGQNWVKFSDLPTHYLSGITTLIGDRNTFGRVYIGTTGNGFLYGDLD
jgi:xyloglucan-specific exo-beta-1,4-glucanase